MKTLQLGKTGSEVAALGLGCMGMPGMYGPSGRAESIATLHAALDARIGLLDTGDFYGMGHNGMLIGEALGSLNVLLSADELSAIERAVPKGAAWGDRCTAAQMTSLDSEANPR